MNKCETCKHRGDEPVEYEHYNPESDDFEERKTYYECQRVSHGNASSSNSYAPGLKAIAVDGSGYHAALCVELDFGCVLWEPK